MTEHCGGCGSQLCNHGACPECAPCRHCDGGDRSNKYFGEQESESDTFNVPGDGCDLPFYR